MEELSQAGRIRIKRFSKPSAALPDDSDMWVGGEASVGTQAGQYVRRNEQNRPGPSLATLGLAFLGGLALGTAASLLLRSARR